MAHPMGESKRDGLRVNFDHRLKLEFHGSKITSDAGLLAYRELDVALGLTEVAGDIFQDSRTGKNGWHGMTGQFRQSLFGCLGGYEDLNNADRLGRDPATRWIVGGKAVDRQAASTSQMGRFETELLATDANIEALADMNGVKFRSYNSATARLAELTGMLPVQIEAAEISQAFATGVADSMVSSGATGYDRKVWESLNYFYEVDAWLPRNYVIVNADTWSGVSDANKKVIQDCAATAEAEGLEKSKGYTQFTMDGLREGGMTVAPASDTLKAELQEIGATMTSDWLEEAGDQGAAIVDAFKAMQ
mgnify:CR=1 FL=1